MQRPSLTVRLLPGLGIVLAGIDPSGLPEQNQSAGIAGTAIDSAGAVVQNATITVTR